MVSKRPYITWEVHMLYSFLKVTVAKVSHFPMCTQMVFFCFCFLFLFVSVYSNVAVV